MSSELQNYRGPAIVTQNQELPRAENPRDIYPLEWLAKAIESARRVGHDDWPSEQRQVEIPASQHEET